MKHPILDRAEVAIDFPEKYYYGSFDRDATYDVQVDDHGVHIELDRKVGERRHVSFHIHYYLLAEILQDLAAALSKRKPMSQSQQDAIQRAVDDLERALSRPQKSPAKKSKAKKGSGQRPKA